MSHLLHRLGRLAARRPRSMIAAWLVVAVGLIAAGQSAGGRLTASFSAPGLDSTAATELLVASGQTQGGLTARVVVTSGEAGPAVVDDPTARATLERLRGRLAALPKVVAVSDPVAAVDAGDPTGGGGLSADGTTAVLVVQYPELGGLEADDLARLTSALDAERAESPLTIEAGGDLYFAFGSEAAGTGEIVGVAVAALVLLVAFGSLLSAGLPIVLALTGLATAMSVLALAARWFDVPEFATSIGAMIGLGVGIDYALLIVTRHREHLADGMDVTDSIAAAVATAGLSAVFAGGTVVVAIAGLAMAQIPFITVGGFAISMVVAVMVLGSITLLPALLALLGRRVSPRRHRQRHASRWWPRWARHVTSYRGAYTVGGSVLLLAAATPVFALRLGFPDEGVLPEHRTERRAYDLVTQGFGPGANGPLVVAVDVADHPELVDPLVRAIAADPGVAAVGDPTLSSDGAVAVLMVEPTDAPEASATADTVHRLRNEVFPRVLAGSATRAHVGGQTATFIDLAGRVQTRLPWFIGTVIAMSLVLLMIVFRSVLVPLKAAVLNLLSIGAAYGVVVMVFQWRWGAGLLGVQHAVPIVSFVPMMMFAIVFGLSMDYEVFLLSRIREEFVRTGNNEAAVIHGIESTARVITSAALIMVSVFAGFIASDDPTIKMFGLGLATAIAVDATIVRLVLVPATMSLMGRANWWLPRWLDRALPQVDIDHDGDRHLGLAPKPISR